MLRHPLFYVDDHGFAERFSVGFRISAAVISACVVPHLLVCIEHDPSLTLTRRLGFCGSKHSTANASALDIFSDGDVLEWETLRFFDEHECCEYSVIVPKDPDLIIANSGITAGGPRPRCALHRR